MDALRLDRWLKVLAGVDLLTGILWLGLAGLTVTLLVLMRTRWGQARPLRKCVVLSLLAHLLLAVYATTVHIVSSGPLEAKEPTIKVTIFEEDIQEPFDARNAALQERPWESFVHESVGGPAPVELARAEPLEAPQPEREPRSEQTEPAGDPSLPELTPGEAVQPEPGKLPADSDPERRRSKAAEPIDAPAAQRREAPRAKVPSESLARQAPGDTPATEAERSHRAGSPSGLLERPLPLPRVTHVPATADPQPSLSGMRDVLVKASRGGPAEWTDTPPSAAGAPPDVVPIPDSGPAATDPPQFKPPTLALKNDGHLPDSQDTNAASKGTSLVGTPVLPTKRRDDRREVIAPIYRLRTAPDRSRLAQLRGATDQTEDAVKAALAWMADNQGPDGQWDARTHGAGRERFVAGRDRQGAGMRADTGMTGLALLAFLACGHTHLDGPYQSNVRRGLEYLMGKQAADGNLGGKASTYARMYCHAMATFALSEAYGMTADERLRESVERAVNYTLAAQDPVGGGWRYNPGDAGDTSQLGWQLMALKSAELAGISIPKECRRRALKFLDSASYGHYGGLAAYRPGEASSRPMTAEALACRQFLGIPPEDPAVREAGIHLLGELPGQGSVNLYYWYYGTLGMYYLQGDHWQQWNRALQRTLLSRQRKNGPLAGSWDPNTVWGGYGGRVYSTALATLCLEVYYRYLPLYLEASVGPPLVR